MKEVTFYRGASPHGDLQPHVVKVDSRGIIRAIDGFDILYPAGSEVSIDDPMPNTFPFCNSYRTVAEARNAATAEYQRRASEALGRLGSLSLSE